MKTVTLQIGNSDNKLAQQEWADYVNEVSKALEHFKADLHFSGGSVNWSPWQNFCWVFTTTEMLSLCTEVAKIRTKYRQDSAAWTEGATAFI